MKSWQSFASMVSNIALLSINTPIMLMGKNFPTMVRGTPWYTEPNRLCIVWFKKPIWNLARMPLLVLVLLVVVQSTDEDG
jgi:hypothetical protein